MKKIKLSDNRLVITLHVMAWIIILVIPGYLDNTFGEGNKEFLIHMYVNLSIYGVLFYLNYLWLVPKLLFRNKKARYFLSAFVLLLVICTTMWYANEGLFKLKEPSSEMIKRFDNMNPDHRMMKAPIRQFKLVDYFYTSLLILGFSLGLKLLEKVSRDEKARKELEKEKLNSELAFLKNQISPHFFFNTLNNIYSLINIDTANARESVLKLSKLMRYLLYESEKGGTRLSEEIAFLNHYIDLMRLRLTSKVDLTVSFPDNYPDITIPPLLFVAFIENAFKHGISNREQSYIHIKLEIDEKRLLFNIRNSVIKSSQAVDGRYSGIGLENVKKRLNLLFPDKYRLAIVEKDGDFSVNLELDMELKQGIV
ncbi:MAG: histidine kinase [Bacteroidales bacterium]|nr:histidine kinase [Bacteroidales bacterium]